LSDRFGRRLPLVIGIAIFVLGSAGCALATDGFQLIGWRVVQALGASAGVALARAMVRDLYDRDRAARVLSTLMTVMAIAPLVGPSLGAQILALASWPAIFWVLVTIGVATAFAVMTLPESLPAEKRVADTAWQAIAGYASVLRNPVLVGYAAAVGFFYAGVFANIAGGSFAYISYYGLSPQAYGLVLSSGVIGLMATNFVNARLVTRLGTERMLLAGAIGATLSGVGLGIVTITNLGGFPALIVTQFIFTAMNGLILANAVAGALSSVQQRAGAASAVIGAIQYGSGMLGSAVVGMLANGSPAPMGIVMIIGGVGCLACVLVTSRVIRTLPTNTPARVAQPR
jgi:DHA1 family bicyclomycin/chloramphenicol resistance-like MFS transporter